MTSAKQLMALGLPAGLAKQISKLRSYSSLVLEPKTLEIPQDPQIIEWDRADLADGWLYEDGLITATEPKNGFLRGLFSFKTQSSRTLRIALWERSRETPYESFARGAGRQKAEQISATGTYQIDRGQTLAITANIVEAPAEVELISGVMIVSG